MAFDLKIMECIEMVSESFPPFVLRLAERTRYRSVRVDPNELLLGFVWFESHSGSAGVQAVRASVSAARSIVVSSSFSSFSRSCPSLIRY